MEKPKARFELFRGKNKDFYWRLVDIGTGNIIADSGEGYKNRKDALKGFRLVVEHSAAALRKHLGKFDAKFELFKDKRGEFRWRLRHINTEIIATPGEGYKNKKDALNDIESIRKNSPTAPVEDLT